MLPNVSSIVLLNILVFYRQRVENFPVSSAIAGFVRVYYTCHRRPGQG